VGIVINPASLNEKISRKLTESHPNSITVSFPSMQKEVFEKLCPTVLFEDALKHTLELVDLSRGKTGLRIAGITTEISSDEQRKYIRFWKDLEIRADMTICHGRGGNLKNSDIYNLKDFGLDSGKCSLFQFHTFVTWEAEVLACCHDLTGDTRIGNLIDDDVSVIAERKQKRTEDAMPFPVCHKCDEPLRHAPSPQGPPPRNRKERIKFFRSISRSNLSL
jgi:hypothetical protein